VIVRSPRGSGVIVSKTLRVSNLNRVPAGVMDHLTRATAAPSGVLAATAVTDDLTRNVFGLLGIPIDAVDFAALLRSVEGASKAISRLLISTPNVNFLVKSQRNDPFRESLLLSDLCLADGMPLIWLAKLLHIPIRERIAGSDLFGRLKSANSSGRRLKVFLVGGAEGVAAMVGAKLNSERSGLECVGVLNPGFGAIEEMSTPEIIDTINASEADLIAVFFGAEKAQAWLMHNHRRLRASIRVQFGATINFEAGIVKRAPGFMRSTGFEWLWRIKEEPYLWRRYWNDGTVLLKLMVTCVLPLAFDARRRRFEPSHLLVNAREDTKTCVVELSGDAVDRHVDRAINHFRKALASGKQVVVDISKTRDIDPRFFGLFLMVRKHLASRGMHLVFRGVSHETRRIFRLNKFEFLLS
jgi:N-acetylglucosaminyldiphosphoundecaprenol N-acetyl-beta-D-mannosaminyltransferase